jgi:hypothetical protein
MKALNVDANFLFADVLGELGIKKTTDSQSAVSTEEALISILERRGVLLPGRDLTERQANALIAIGTLLNEIFERD